MTTFPPPETLLTIESLVSFLDGVTSKPFNWRVFIQGLDSLCGYYIQHEQKDLLLVLLGYIYKHTKQHDMQDIVLTHIRRCIEQCNPVYLFLLVDRYLDYCKRSTCFVTGRGDLNLLEFAYQCTLATREEKPMYNQVIHGLMQRGWPFLSNEDAGDFKRTITRCMGTVVQSRRNRLVTNLDGIRLLFTLASVYSVKRLGMKSTLVKVKLPLDVIRKMRGFLM